MLFDRVGLLLALAAISVEASSACGSVNGAKCAAQPANDHALPQTYVWICSLNPRGAQYAVVSVGFVWFLVVS